MRSNLFTLSAATIGAVLFLLLLGCGEEGTTAPDASWMDSIQAYQRTVQSAEQCKQCHPKHYQEWAMSMHRYSMVDPVFFALDSIGRQRSGGLLDQFCVQCHSPLTPLLGVKMEVGGRSMLPPVAHEGINCDACHKIVVGKKPPNGGPILITADTVYRGPIKDPIPNSFHISRYDPQFETSEVCQACHDFHTPAGFFIERTFTEWKNSTFPGRGIHCQTCHMKHSPGQVAVNGPVRDRVHSHVMEGVDIPLVDFPGREEMIQRVDYLLKYSLRMMVTHPDTIVRDRESTIIVELANTITGHNIPTGSVFERQMWIFITLVDPRTQDTLFVSGDVDPNGDVRDHHSEYVQAKLLPLDSQLVVFRGVPLRNGKEIPFFWEADAVLDRTIPPFESRHVVFRIPPLQTNSPTVHLSVRLLFRSFPPYLLRKIGLGSLVSKLVTFEMERYEVFLPVR